MKKMEKNRKKEHAIQNPVLAILRNFNLKHVHITTTCKLIHMIIN